ncbi:MAG: hypothetical protein NVSMB64_13170 [Candidatus Velthaea sp.]
MSWYDALGKRHYKSKFYWTRKELILDKTALVAKYAARSIGPMTSRSPATSKRGLG